MLRHQPRQGTNAVGSIVVFEDGLRRTYCHFLIRGGTPDPVTGEVRADDTAAMHEVLTRRFRRYLESQDAAVDPTRTARDDEGRPARFAYPPNLVVVDGGAPQVNAAVRALDELGIDDVAVVGLAKRLEEVWLPGEEFPVILPRSSEGLYLLQRVRDEAHRFAITFHRKRRSTSMTRSALDDIPGLGPARQKALLAHFGSLKRIRAASAADLAAVKGIGPALADAIVAALGQTEAPAPAVDALTGEIREDGGTTYPADAGSPERTTP